MPADEQLATYGRFYMHSALKGDPHPDQHNKPVYHDVLMCEISIKGDKNTSVSKRVFEDDGETPIMHPNLGDLREIYPRAWKAYQMGSEEYMDGTPLDVIPGLGVSGKRNLQSEGIQTVEDLAGLPDNVVIGKSGMLDLRKKAQAYLAAMEPEKEDAEKQAMLDKMAEMEAKIAELSKPKRGRPKREENIEA